MKEIYKNYLFTKHILVSEHEEGRHQFETLCAIASKFGIYIKQGKELIDEGLIHYISEQLGISVPEPFYRGFPRTVRALSKDELLFDQMLHYINDSGFNHSVLEEYIGRDIFMEHTEVKYFDILSENDAENMLYKVVQDMVSSTRPLNDAQYNVVKEFVNDYAMVSPASKNLTVRLLVDTRNTEFVKFLRLPDVIKVVSELNYRVYENRNMKKLSFANRDRKFITQILDLIFEKEVKHNDIIECYEKQKIWCGLLHHIHYKGKVVNAQYFVNGIRSGFNSSCYHVFERLMQEGNIVIAARYLTHKKGDAALLRNLDYILSRAMDTDEINDVLNMVSDTNGIVLLQMLMHYAQYDFYPYHRRSFKFTRFNQMLVHDETTEELDKRKSLLKPYIVKKARCAIITKLLSHYNGTLGSCYIDPEMYNIALPLQENVSFTGIGTLTKGSRISIPSNKKIRVFTYWEQANDIDLSVMGLHSNGTMEEFSWRSMRGKQTEAIIFSGDETRGYDGGSEYFDIDLDMVRKIYPDITHFIFCNNVYSGESFSNAFCKAGYMTRDILDTGNVYEPKTVQSAFRITCNSRFAYLFALDVEKNELIWLNIPRESNCRIAGETNFQFIKKYFDITSVINLGSFIDMCAKEFVGSPEEADVIVSDSILQVRDDQQLIHSYDIESVLALMNK